MNVELFLTMLFGISLLTSLVVEAIKKMFEHSGTGSRPNVLAAIVSVVLSVVCYWGYTIYMETAFTAQGAVFLLALVMASWLSAMLGYDKVIQTVKQIITKKEEKEDDR